MTAAFVLAINLSISGIFAVAFAVVAATNRTARGARWLAFGYAMGIINVLLEFALPMQSDPTPIAISIFLVFLLALTFCLIGVARHYNARPPRMAVTAIWIASILAIPIIFTLTYNTPARGLLYQLPYAAMQSVIGFTVFRSHRRQPLDLLFLALNGLAAMLYLVKPLIGSMVGTANAPQGYMASLYAVISQSISSVMLVALALVVLLVMMRDTTAEIMARSETDALSGVLNRRGFDAHAERMLTEARRDGAPLTLIAADLDHFKTINDSFGHAAGDRVIVHFAALLGRLAGGDAIISRLGGEEFAVLAPCDVAEGRRFAEAVRDRLSGEPLAKLEIDRAVTASFGVAQMMPGDSLFDLSRRADAALYRAKADGRNRVNLALGELSPVQPLVPVGNAPR